MSIVKTAFMSELDTTSTTRMITEIIRGGLGKGKIKRFISSAKYKHEKFVKHLGVGGSQKADLVLHPKHGLVVRKVPRHGVEIKDLIKSGDWEANRWLMNLQKNRKTPGFAKIIEMNPKTGIYFQEYVPGETVSDRYLKGVKSGSSRKLKALIGTKLSVLRKKLKSGAISEEEYGRILDKKGKAYSIYRRMVGRSMKGAKLTKEQEDMIKLIKKEYPFAHDFRGQNIIINPKTREKKLVDFSSGGKGPNFYIGADKEKGIHGLFKMRSARVK